MAHKLHLVFAPGLAQGTRHAVRGAADVVNTNQVGVLLQQHARLGVVFVGIVLAFAQADHLHGWKHLLHDVQKTRLALLVGAVAQ